MRLVTMLVMMLGAACLHERQRPYLWYWRISNNEGAVHADVTRGPTPEQKRLADELMREVCAKNGWPSGAYFVEYEGANDYIAAHRGTPFEKLYSWLFKCGERFGPEEWIEVPMDGGR
jgi:hypothetical protein